MKRALDRGLYLMTHWNVVMCCPPLTITRDELDEALDDPRRRTHRCRRVLRLGRSPRSPAAFLPGPPRRARVVDDSRFYLRVSADGPRVQRLPAAARRGDVPAIAEIALIAPAAAATWCRRPVDAPADLEEHFVAPAAASRSAADLPRYRPRDGAEPPAVAGVEVRRVESYDDFVTLLELAHREAGPPRRRRARARGRRHWARRAERAGRRLARLHRRRARRVRAARSRRRAGSS